MYPPPSPPLPPSPHPASNVPETARICRITHAPPAACPAPTLAPLEPGGRPVTGAAAISARLRSLNAEARAHLRSAADERVLDITAPLVALGEGGPGGACTRLCLLDTPGPNEAGEEGLRFQVGEEHCARVLFWLGFRFWRLVWAGVARGGEAGG